MEEGIVKDRKKKKKGRQRTSSSVSSNNLHREGNCHFTQGISRKVNLSKHKLHNE